VTGIRRLAGAGRADRERDGPVGDVASRVVPRRAKSRSPSLRTRGPGAVNDFLVDRRAQRVRVTVVADKVGVPPIERIESSLAETRPSHAGLTVFISIVRRLGVILPLTRIVRFRRRYRVMPERIRLGKFRDDRARHVGDRASR